MVCEPSAGAKQSRTSCRQAALSVGFRGKSEAKVSETIARTVSCLKGALHMWMLAQEGGAGLPSLCAYIDTGT